MPPSRLFASRGIAAIGFRASSALLAALLIAAAQAQPIQVPAQEKAPHKFILSQGEPSGICPDLMRALQRQDPRLHFVGFDSALSLSLIEQGLRSAQVGAACALLDQPDRHAYARRLMPPLYQVQQRVAVASTETAQPATLQQLLALAGDQPVIVVRGSAYPTQLRSLGFRVDDSTGDNQAILRMLLAGRARFFYGGEQALLRSIQAAGLQERIRLLPAVFQSEPIYFWTSHKLPSAQTERLEKALRQLQASGELARIVQHYHDRP